MTTAPKCQAKDPSACVDPNCPEKLWRATQLSTPEGLNEALDSLDKKATKKSAKPAREVPAHIQETLDNFASRVYDLAQKDVGLTVSDLEFLYEELRDWDENWDEAADNYGDELDEIENNPELDAAKQRASIADYYWEAYENGGEEKARKWTAQKYGKEFWQILKEREDWEESVINYNSY